MRKLFGHTWVGWLNIFVLQWFWVRLAYGDWWCLLFPVAPLTGWWRDFPGRGNREVRDE